MSKSDVKRQAQVKYLKFREAGLSHSMALAAVLDWILSLDSEPKK